MADLPPPVAEVVVSAARLPTAAGAAAFSSVRLDSEALAAKPRLDEVLSQAPGVSLFRRTSSRGANPTTQGLSLRSIAPSGAGRALVTLDGVPQNDPFGGWVIWSALPVEGLDGVTLTRGAGAGPYGGGALTGAVGLSSLERSGPVDQLRLSSVTPGLGRAAVTASHPFAGGDLLLVGSAERDRGWVPVRAGRGAADDRLTLDAHNASLRYKAELGPATVEARVTGFEETRGAGLVGAGSRARGAQASLSAAAAPAGDRLGWRAQAWMFASDLRNTSVAPGPNRAFTTLANDQYSTPALGVGVNAAVRRSSAGSEWELGADARYTDGDEHERFRYVSGAFTRNRIAGGRTAIVGLYGEGTRRLGPWLLTGDVRGDLWRSSDGHRMETDLASGAPTLTQRFDARSDMVPSARFGVRRALAANLFLRSAAYATFRPPTLNELYRPFRVGADVTEANAALSPERLYGVEIGAGREGRSLDWAVTAFANRLEEPVTNVTVGVGPGTFGAAGFIAAGGVLRMRQNAGRIDALGVEAELKRRWGERLQVRAALGYTVAEVDGVSAAPQLTGLRPAQAPRLTVTAGADWRATRRLRLSADLRGETQRFEDDLNTRRLAPALTVNARAAYQLARGVEVSAAVDNLTDAAVQTGRTADGIASYDAPRTLRLALTLGR